MCPVTPIYIKKVYCDKDGNPVRISENLARELRTRAKSVLIKQRKGIKLIFPDVLKIEKELIKDINKEQD